MPLSGGTPAYPDKVIRLDGRYSFSENELFNLSPLLENHISII